MRYVIMIYSSPATWVHPMFLHQHEPLTPEQREARVGEFETLLKEIVESGELVDSAALADPVIARTVRLRDGVLAAADGPFTDAKEQLAGYFVVDCATPERAEEIAARFPDTRNGGAEIRPVVDLSGLEM
jgi:hypothetical protein